MKKRFLLSLVIMLSILICGIITANAADFIMINGTVSISDAPLNSTLITAAYDENNALLGCKMYENEGNYDEDLDISKAHSVRAFLWDMNTLKPFSSGNDVLVVYFSATNTTENLAKNIHAKAGGDLIEILPVQPYTSAVLNYNDSDSRANTEINTDSRPEILTRITDIDQYNTIIIGYPIWWGSVPPVVRTFLDSYDLSGKTIMPFCTSGGSGISGSMAKIRELCPNSTVTAGLDRRTETDIENWLTNTGFYTRLTPKQADDFPE